MLPDEPLAKAAHNAARLEEYFAAHLDWGTDSGGLAALHALHSALTRALAAGLWPLLERHDLALPRGGPEWCVARLPAGLLEAERVQRFGVFVQQLGDWLMTLPEVRVSDRGRELLTGLARALAGTAAAVEQMLAASGVEVTPLGPEERSPPPEPDPPPSAAAVRLTDEARDARLVLEDSESTPVLQTFQGKLELTFEAQQALAQFLEESGIQYNSYQRTRLERKVLQWVQAAPPRSVLVIRVGDLTGRPEPYPSYTLK